MHITEYHNFSTCIHPLQNVQAHTHAHTHTHTHTHSHTYTHIHIHTHIVFIPAFQSLSPIESSSSGYLLPRSSGSVRSTFKCNTFYTINIYHCLLIAPIQLFRFQRQQKILGKPYLHEVLSYPSIDAIISFTCIL